ncbi:hypothetical protein [uncultured Methanobrevibacter sp.]|uniref:hypothetical protein n=1 Tax=uncultured Methanobrevibacter sp. TaxID=253161 RepID=UPI0025E3E97B|nr:hypothetical protein [uncultured Methanobrevibacter sp.]
MKTDHPKVATVINFNNSKYTFLRSKKNILIYVEQPVRDYYGYIDGGRILVVKYNCNTNVNINNRYYVLHEIILDVHYNFITNDLRDVKNRCATPIKFE